MKPSAILLRAVVTTIFLMPAVLFATQRAGSGPTPATGTAEITGVVMSVDTTPMPVRRATVTLSDGAKVLLIAVTSDSGEFAFSSLPAGEFTLSATKGGYLPAKYGARLPGGVAMPIVLSTGQRAAGVRMQLQKGGALTGIVTDEDGQPVPDARVQAFKRGVSDRTGEPTLQAAPFATTQVSDDRGRYRIWGLEAGEYAVSATSPLGWDRASLRSDVPEVQPITEADVRKAQGLLSQSGTPPGSPGSNLGASPATPRVTYAPVFFPSAAAPADASLVRLGPQEERDGVNIRLRMVPTAKVQGVVTGPDGAPIANAEIVMMDPGPLPLGTIALAYRNATSDRNGKYSLPGITPGTYKIFVSSAYRDVSPLWAVSEVVVAGRDIDAPIQMRPALTISGRLVFEGTSPPPPDMTAALPWITNSHEGPSMGGLRVPSVAPDGTFTLTVMGGKYRVGAGFAPPPRPIGGWILKSLVINGTNVEDVAFDVTQNIDGAVVTLTDRTAEISGTLQDAAGKPTSDFVLLAFSADKRFRLPQSRRTQLARPDANGHFAVRNLPAGEYILVALTDVDPSQLIDPAFFADLEAQAAIKVTLAEGEKKVQNIKAGGGDNEQLPSSDYRRSVIGDLISTVKLIAYEYASDLYRK